MSDLDTLRHRTGLAIGEIAAVIAVMSTLIGGGAATILFLADIRAEQRVTQAELLGLRAQVTRIEVHLDKGR